MNDVMPRATIDEIVAKRAEALRLYDDVWDALVQARQAQALAGGGDGPDLCMGRYGSTHHFRDQEDYREKTRQAVDRGIWSRVMNATGIEMIMDVKERDRMREEMRENPAEATAENVWGVFDRLRQDSGMIWRRGVAEAFSHLDRRFRSHDGFKVGTRIIITWAFAEHGSWHQRAREVIRDVERALYVLDGKTPPEYSEGIAGAVDQTRTIGKRFTGEARTEYLRLVGYKNGNAHLWFERPDLVRKVNLLLAQHYGEALGEGFTTAEKKAHRQTTAVAKNMGWFASPDEVVRRLLDMGAVPTPTTHSGKYEQLRILEPSAGEGAIALAAVRAGHHVSAIELHPGREAELRKYERGYPELMTVHRGDFLKHRPRAVYDRVLMNPPFDGGLDIEHVRHAFGFLKPGGMLAAVMSAGTAYREDKRTQAFREWATPLSNDRWGRDLCWDLPTGSFKESGTMVNACIVVLRRPA